MQKVGIISIDKVKEEKVKWIWEPYIPKGKITIIQGDPGDGKTTLALSLIAFLTTGKALPGENGNKPPINVIYQTAEDGLADTIKPRLLSMGADCSKVFVINEEERELTLSDSRIEQAIVENNVQLLIFDPMQAYIGSKTDMNRANEIRPIFKKLTKIAEKTDCAVILIGHMNKTKGTKTSYRGLGSIDFRASARSVLVVGRSRENIDTRIVAHDKSNLAYTGRSVVFKLTQKSGFVWKDFCDITPDELLSESSPQTKLGKMEMEIVKMLSMGNIETKKIFNRGKELGIGERTIKTAKKNVGVHSFKKGNVWYSQFENDK